MPVFKDVIIIRDTPYDRAVKVTVIYPEGQSVLNVQERAERAWRSVGKKITAGKVTVKVEALRR